MMRPPLWNQELSSLALDPAQKSKSKSKIKIKIKDHDRDR